MDTIIPNRLEKITNDFLTLDVSKFTEEKNKLTYLSWANAMREALKIYSDLDYDIIRDEQGKAYFGDEKTGYMVYTTVTIEGKTRMCWLPVMDFRNKSMLNPTTFDINKAIMRCLTKNLAMFGLGLYIYAGEDLPEKDKSLDEPVVDKNIDKPKSDLKLTAFKKQIKEHFESKISKDIKPMVLNHFKVVDITLLNEEQVKEYKEKYKI